MKLQVQSYNNAGLVWNAEAEETNFRSYSIEHTFNGPAKAIITLADTDGSMLRKYNADNNDVYLGAGKVTIEDPTGTDIFLGRIIKATGSNSNKTLTLECLDWLDQLDERLITYDMREDLGSNLRQSVARSDQHSPDYVGPAYNDGSKKWFWDDAMTWDQNEFDGKKLIFTAGMAGSIKVKTGPYTDTITWDGGTHAETGDFYDLWVDDVNQHTAWDDDADFRVVYEFRTYVGHNTPSDLYVHDSITGARIHWAGSPATATGAGRLYVEIWTGASYTRIGELPNLATGIHRHETFEVPDTYVDDIVDSDGIVKVRFEVDHNAESTQLASNYLMVEVDVSTTGYSSSVTINDTQKTGATDFDRAYMYEDGVGYTDETVDLADTGINDVQLLPNPFSRHDAFYFGSASVFHQLTLTIGTAGVHGGTADWEYWDGDSWESLAGISDATNFFETAGTKLLVSWTMPGDWATTAVNGQTHYWVRARNITAAPGMATTPLGTQGWVMNSDGNKLEVATDLTAAATRIWENVPYCITQPIFKHIASDETPGGLITDGDLIVPLTCAGTIEHTNGISTRQYKERTRLEILRDLAAQDKAVFWIAWDGTNTTVTYKKTFGADTQQLTDAKILEWSSLYDYHQMVNDYHVYGARIGDYEIFQEAADAGSVLRFKAYRTKVLKNAGLVSDYDAATTATTLAARDATLSQMVNCTIAGNTATAAHDTTIKLGEIVEITSSYLWPVAAKDYIVTRFVYDSKAHKTYLTLQPKVSIGLQEIDSLHTRGERMQQTIKRAEGDKYVADPVTHEVTNP